MTTKNAIHWFEIPATNLERAAKFYEVILGIKLKRMTENGAQMAIFETAEGGVSGCVNLEEKHRPGDTGPRIYLDAPHLDEAVARVAGAGGTVVLPTTAIGPHGFIALVKDPEGNTVGLHRQ